MTSAINPTIRITPGFGKSNVIMAAAQEFTRPKGTWKEYWTRHLLNISPASRLPRGFNPTLAAKVSITFDMDSAGDTSRATTASWMDLNRSSISEAVQKLAPDSPAKKVVRKRAKPADSAGK